jgi:septum formation protein
MDIVLASGSPRRRELLEMLGLEFSVVPAKGAEIAPEGAGPDETVAALSRAKAEEVAQAHPASLIIAADTIVWADGRILGKPKDTDDAKAMLGALSGRAHEVYTGVTLIYGGRILSAAECTKVFFRALTDDEIDRYIATGEPMDKAGAYGIQGRASLMIKRIEGDYFNVMGLPLCRFGQMLEEIGVQLF